MDLIEIDIVQPQPTQRIVDAVHDVFARHPTLVRAVSDRAANLSRNHNLFAVRRKFLQGAPDHLFALPERIDVRRVKEIDASLERALEEWKTVLHVENPVAPFWRTVGHRSQADPRNLETGFSKWRQLHDVAPLARGQF